MQSDKTKLFIDKARAKHGDRYDYSKTVYVHSKEKVTITCDEHGEFEQIPNSHLCGSACSKCAIKKRESERMAIATKVFINSAKRVHGRRYEYDKVVYKRNDWKVTIICKRHGSFEQIPASHLSGYGCAKCSGRHIPSTEEWITKAREVHGSVFDYSKVRYVSAYSKVIITCGEHGEFYQAPNCHLRGNGCPMCHKRYDQPTSVYALSNGEQIKVGISVNPQRRLSQVNVGQPFTAELLHEWELPDFPAARAVEQAVHAKLAEHNAGLSGFDGATEWFNVTPAYAADVIAQVIEAQ